ncbi:hypothetical protein [Nocardiopsis sp. FIRDI 009]|uniref:hypothetical protein n=1 Tax=Nocardiopsis sp. FIRDI 009 TaxID=714197 RepID=UPI0013008491|nr:hypothetical protein [Nocardiopsis sp. FIRDI 009]
MSILNKLGRGVAAVAAACMAATVIQISAASSASAESAPPVQQPAQTQEVVEVQLTEEEWETLAAAAACSGPRQPYKSGSNIKASYSGCNYGGQWRFVLQRHRWWGWTDMTSSSMSPSSQTISASCSGSGNHNYRSVFRYSNKITKTSPSYRVTC